jgi:adenylate cyclase
MYKALSNKYKHASISLRFSILSTFIVLFVLLTLSIALIRSIAFKDELIYTSFELMKRTSSLILKEVTTSINPIEVDSKFSAKIFGSGLIVNSIPQLMTYTYHLVDSTPLLKGAYWGDEQGNLVFTRQEPGDTISTEVIQHEPLSLSHYKIFYTPDGRIARKEVLLDNHFDPRTRPWYTAAKQVDRSVWTGVYLFYQDNVYGVSLGSPVIDANKNFLGVFGLDIRLDFLSRFITKQYVSKNGFAFIVTKKEDLIAYPDKPPFENMLATSHALINIHQSPRFLLVDNALDLFKKTGLSEFPIRYQGKRYLVTFRPIPAFASQGWLVGVIAPEDDFVAYLHKINWITLGFTLLALLVGIILVSGLVTRIVKPIKLLVKETEKIKRFELEGDLKIASHITEVMDLRDAISSMKNGLQQFQHYVPKILVRQLIESGQSVRIGGVRKRLVVFFSDIENFTTIAETMEPTELVDQICEYFEALTQIIILEKGTIDKYIGDSIMAFWGAPLPEEKASEHAAKAALACIAKVEELNAKWAQAGKPIFITRIGIHTGDAIVGNLGSSERFNYTALGDTINIANRFETINKIYKTHIIVGEAVYQEIKNNFLFRKLDSVVVKGRKNALNIYELLGDELTHLPFNLAAYNAAFEQGFVAYQSHDYRSALGYFKQCLALYPQDSIAAMFVEKCKANI